VAPRLAEVASLTTLTQIQTVSGQAGDGSVDNPI
jgi:hypothetical protein